jgi:hypothetical protein
MRRTLDSVPITNSTLHHRILTHFIQAGYAPSVDELAAGFNQPRDAVVAGLHKLQEYHGVVLHPKTSEIWVSHPFSTAPTNFWVESGERRWWGNCAWCSLGIAALAGGDVTITTTLGGESRQVNVRIVNGKLEDDAYIVHFPIPMQQAWDNVIFTCSTMLLFESEVGVNDWSHLHHIPRGDIQPLANVWAFAKVWYGRHLDENWAKWSATEAKAIFQQFGLDGPVWDLPAMDSRF